MLVDFYKTNSSINLLAEQKLKIASYELNEHIEIAQMSCN
jgi:hypothetical protein